MCQPIDFPTQKPDENVMTLDKNCNSFHAHSKFFVIPLFQLINIYLVTYRNGTGSKVFEMALGQGLCDSIVPID